MERGRISRMSGQPTRGALPPETSQRSGLGWVPAQWRAFAAFLRRPRLPDRAELSVAGSLRALVPLLVLDLLLMALVLAAIGAATALGFKLPEHMLGGLELTPALLAFMLVGAPVGEEILFRGWLSGRPGHIIGSLLCVIGAALVAGGAAAGAAGSGGVAVWSIAAGGGVLLLAALTVFALRKRDALHWFQRHFAWFFYASTLAFAAIHLSNFAGAGAASMAAMLPLVLPQLLLGLILGFVRVQHGLLTNISLHALHNALFASLRLLGLE